MTSAKLAVVILAAGQGTRLESARPKVLHEVAGKAMLDHVLDSAATLAPERTVVVLGPGMEAVAAAARARGDNLHTVVQDRRLGTGDAVARARPALTGYLDPGDSGDVLVAFGDTPLLTAETLQAMAATASWLNPGRPSASSSSPTAAARSGRLSTRVPSRSQTRTAASPEMSSGALMSRAVNCCSSTVEVR